MKNLFFKILLAIDIFAIAIYGICSFFITKYDAVQGVMTDGFGRAIVEPPLFFRWYLCIGEWVGLGWFIVDAIGFFISVFVASLLYKKIKETK
jgi:hypothetical protein